MKEKENNNKTKQKKKSRRKEKCSKRSEFLDGTAVQE